MNPFEKVSEANEHVTRAISMVSSKKELIFKQAINVVLLFIILLVFGCLDFATLKFHFENLTNINYYGTVLSKTIAGICAFNIGINIMWDVELKKDKILADAILLYNHMIEFKDDKDFEFFVNNIFNVREKIKAYIAKINKRIYRLNRVSRKSSMLLYSSEVPEGVDNYDERVRILKERKEKNKYCCKRAVLEELKSNDYIKKNIDSIKVNYSHVEPAVFNLEIDGAVKVHGVKVKGNVGAEKVKASGSVAIGMIGFSMFVTAIALELNQEQFANQMTRFWHYVLKCATDVGVILWQTYRGMLRSRKIISSEFTQPFTGRNEVLKSYFEWKFKKGAITETQYNEIVNYKGEAEVTLTEKQFKKLQELEEEKEEDK